MRWFKSDKICFFFLRFYWRLGWRLDVSFSNFLNLSPWSNDLWVIILFKKILWAKKKLLFWCALFVVQGLSLLMLNCWYFPHFTLKIQNGSSSIFFLSTSFVWFDFTFTFIYKFFPSHSRKTLEQFTPNYICASINCYWTI